MCLDPSTYVEACEQTSQPFYELSSRAELLSYLGWVAPFAVGLVLGVPLVSREVEQRTAGMAWALSRSRTAWLLRRVAFAAMVLLCLLLVLAIAASPRRRSTGPPPGSRLRVVRATGSLLMARGLAAGIGVLLGAVPGAPAALLLAAFIGPRLHLISFGVDRWWRPCDRHRPGLRDRAVAPLGQRVELPAASDRLRRVVTARPLSRAIDERAASSPPQPISAIRNGSSDGTGG
jgi:hypothetical protein